MNLRELYHQYKKRYPNNPVSKSKFISLRTKYCVTVDAKDTLQACVCSIHETVDLMTEVIPGGDKSTDFIAKVVCDINNPDCMIH